MPSEPSVHAPTNVPTMTMAEQADWLLALWDRTFMPSDGAPAAEAVMMLSREDGDILHAIGSRIARIAPHERAVRDLVVGSGQ